MEPISRERFLDILESMKLRGEVEWTIKITDKHKRWLMHALEGCEAKAKTLGYEEQAAFYRDLMNRVHPPHYGDF